MNSVTEEQILDRLRTVKDPELFKDIVSLEMVKDISIDGARVRIGIELTTPACPLKDEIQRDVVSAVKPLGFDQVEVDWSARVRSSRDNRSQLPGVKNIIAVGAGKGGVGKSTAAVLLAHGLSRSGASVGLMDADVYGPSIPTMMGIEGTKPEVSGNMIFPPEANGVKIISIGFMVDRDKPLIWRGPMVHGVVKQFLEQVQWGELDYLIVDLPPGTGDVPLTLAQSIPMTGSVIVCTPQDVALIDARRAIKMYEQLNVACIGILENMSYYLCPKCGNRDELFDHGGARRSAEEMGVPFLGEIPLNAKIRINSDSGEPARTFEDMDQYMTDAVNAFVSATAAQVSIRANAAEQAPTLSIE